MLKKYLLIPVILLIIFSGCEKKDPLTKMFNEAENLEAKIVQNYNSITACRMNYEKILIQAPDSPYAPVACFKLAKLNEVLGHYDDAIAYYQKLLTTYPNHRHAADGLLSMARIYQLNLNKTDDAIQTYQQFLAFYPEDPARPDAYLQQTNLLIREKNFTAAIENFKKIITEFPNSELKDDAYFRLGMLYQHQLKDSVAANSWYQLLLKDYPGSSWASFARKRLIKGGNTNEK
jgi:TolA-binding protein